LRDEPRARINITGGVLGDWSTGSERERAECLLGGWFLTWATPTAARQQHRRTNCVASLGVDSAARVDSVMDAASMRTPPNLLANQAHGIWLVA